MYIRNLTKTALPAFICNQYTANFLTTQAGLEVIYREDKYFYFADTEKLRESLSLVPWWVKALDNILAIF